MIPQFAKALAVLLAFTAAALSPAEEAEIRLCADSWMPYNGDPEDAQRPGYVVELARTIFGGQGVRVTYSTMPWKEALAAVAEGRMSAAIGANKIEGKGLTIPEEPIGAPAVCLLTRKGSTWSYSNVTSFREVRLGVIKDYAYWPDLDTYIAKRAGKGVVVADDDQPLETLMNRLLAGEIDVVAESEPVLLWYLRAHELDRSDFRVVYKGDVDPIYLAFSPTDEGRRHAAAFDAGIRALRASGELEKLLKRYGLRDWQ